MKKYRYVLLDLDNTLYDTRQTEHRAINSLMEFLGNDIQSQKLISLYKKVNMAAWHALENGELHITKLNYERFRKFLEAADIDYDYKDAAEIYLELLAKNHLFLPNAKSVYQYLTKNYQVALITNGLKKAQMLRIENSFIDLNDSPLFTAEDLGTHKPDPAVVDVIANDLNWIDKDRMILIGDSLKSDIQCAINAHIDCIWCNFINEIQDSYSPTYSVKSLTEIKKIL